jgi:outer membrane protein OmpA-like peptidoglycan-associated protein
LRSLRLFSSLLICLLLAPLAVAQDVVYDITYEDQLRLVAPATTGETGLFSGILGETLRQGDWSFSIYWNNYDYLAAAPLPSMVIPSRRTGREMDVDENRISASFAYGLTDRWEFAVSVPYVMLDQNAGDLSGFVNGFPYRGRFDENGLGNVHVATKFALIDPRASDSRLALSLFADLPTGDDDGAISTGSTDWGLGLHWNRRVFSFGASYAFRGDRDFDIDNDQFNVGRFDMPNELRLDAGLNIPLRWWRTTNWINEINAILYQGGDRQPDDIVYLVTGLRHWFGTSGWGISAGLRANATMWNSDSNSCPFGGLFGLHFAPMHLTPVSAPPPPPVVTPPPVVEPVTPPPPPIVTPSVPRELRTDEINFEPGSARLTNIAKAILDDVALRMRQEPASTAIVIGYTDNRENTGANRDLDRRRAEAVRDYLVSRHGIDPSRIQVEGRGTTEAVGDNATSEGRLRNRRAVIRLMLP